MPTFTAIALDRLLEPGASKSVVKTVPTGKPPSLKAPISKLERRTSTPAKDKTVVRPSPALYTTPDAIPVPDSPSSFPPSPYIINHKARGPRILKSFSEVDVSFHQKALDEGKTNGDADTKGANLKKSTSFTFSNPEPIEEECVNGVHGSLAAKDKVNGIHDGPVLAGQLNGHPDGELGSGRSELDSSNRARETNNVINSLERENVLPKTVAVKADREESEDFYDPNGTASFISNTELEDDTGAETSRQHATPMGEFYDAWEELSSDSGMQASVRNIEADLSEIRLSLLMEIEKRKQAEEALDLMCRHWQRIRQQLAQVGLAIPADPIGAAADGEQHEVSLAEDLSCQFDVARYVSDSIGRGIAKAEVEMEMEAMLEAKNFEITRLTDRLHYYEAVNQEMSQRNQEAVEVARRDRQRRKRMQRWIWGSIAATITLGSAALAWSYIPSGKSSASTAMPQAPEADDVSK